MDVLEAHGELREGFQNAANSLAWEPVAMEGQ